MNLFYTKPENVTGSILKLVEQEASHAAKVLRYRVGDRIFVSDGEGNRYDCRITDISKKEVICSISESEFEDRKQPHIALLIGLIKKRDRLEFAVEKAVELGADEIIIYRGDHSEKGNARMERVEGTVISAMKQSLRSYLPSVCFFEDLKSALDQIGQGTALVYADETEKGPEIPHLNEKQIGLIIGPEGGFSDKERELLAEKGGEAYSLGDKRLRTETAAITITDRYKNSLQR